MNGTSLFPMGHRPLEGGTYDLRDAVPSHDAEGTPSDEPRGERMTANTSQGGSGPRGTRDDRPTGPVVALAFGIAVVLIVAGGLLGLGLGMRAHGPMSAHRGMAAPAMPAGGAGFMLTNVSAEVAGHYQAARAGADDFRAVPCLCGCEATLGHRNLYDCFVTPGDEWESHAAGCVVCVEESARVQRMAERGLSPADMHDRIVDEFGALAGVN